MENVICKKEEIAKWLEGTHILQGIQVIPNYELEDSWCSNNITNAILIRLDDVNYLFVEDPDDGYRSYMGEIMTTDRIPKYTLPNVEVIIKHNTEPLNRYCSTESNIYDFYESDNLILRVGTEDIGDYYPGCILEYYPENLKCNQAVKEYTSTTTVFDLVSKLTKLPYDAPIYIRANPNGNYDSFLLKDLDVIFYDGAVTIEGDEV